MSKKKILKMERAKPHNDGRHILNFSIETDTFKVNPDDVAHEPVVIIIPVTNGENTVLNIFAPQPPSKIMKDSLVQALNQLANELSEEGA